MDRIPEHFKGHDFESLKNYLGFDSLDTDLVLIEDISKIPFCETPVVQAHNVSIICLSGSIDLGIDLQRHTIAAPALIITRRGQVSQYFAVSTDFKALVFSGSEQFMDRLEIDMQKALPVFLYMKDHPFTTLAPWELDTLKDAYQLLKKIVNQPDNAYQKDIVKQLLHATFYVVLDIFKRRQAVDHAPQSHHEQIFEAFIRQVKTHYKTRRQVKFYADQLFLTPKYLSSVIKAVSGITAGEWIDKHVVLGAQALLKSSQLSIQQISDQLNFPNQSFFGKYFKRHTGLSPKKYRT